MQPRAPEQKRFFARDLLVLSHSHRALARWSTLAEVPRNRFNGFHRRAPLTNSSPTAFKRSEEEKTVETVLWLLKASVVTGLKPGLNESKSDF